MPDDLAEIAAVAVVADRAVEGFILADVEFRLLPVEGGKTCLGIEIDCEYAVAAQSEILGEMGGGRGLAASALEIDDGDDLKVLAIPTARNVTANPLPRRVQVQPQAPLCHGWNTCDVHSAMPEAPSLLTLTAEDTLHEFR